MMQFIAAVLISTLGSYVGAVSFSDKELQAELDHFRENPKQFYNTLPPKKGRHFKAVERGPQGRKLKINQRSRILKRSQPWRSLSHPNRNDLVQNLLEESQFISNIRDLELQALTKGEIAVKPWSDDYWPYYKGAIAARYGDSAFPQSADWKVNYDYFLAHPFLDIFENGSAPNINSLSPAEKYDLVIGAKNGALTPVMWQEGEAYYKSTGKVETWMGLCHGWAPASYMQRRPQNSVEVLAFDGKTKIKFYPSDIKALTTLLWSNARTPVRFIGGRCNHENPGVDSIGRPTDPDCLDTNPATWHLALTNRVGVAKRSFIMDATYDYQVWNQPIVSYTYSYFNPKTLDLAPDLKKAMIPVSDFADDKFKQFRNPKAHFIVGIKMQTTYVIENSPSQRESNTPESDSTSTASYTYDLEIDETGVIVGGEWYRNAHPDFLWTPTKDARAMARNDYYLLGEALWDGSKPLPKAWQDHGKESAHNGLPLMKIIDSLIVLGN